MAAIPAASPSVQGGQDLPRLKLWLADRIGSSLAKKVKLARTPEVIQLIHEQFRLGCQHAGHDGSLTTIHANNPRDAISRLETLVPGLRPSYDERLKTRGFNLPGTMFMRRR